ncbi:YqgE/AlgH family protein [Lysobacter soyae]|uniref:UPF0301 protein H8L67_02845 n=1 Tax=Lysobacter soyae TaxID=2764185 RepID=A0ABX8WRK0_9GAMM|nr:YqgE/AlgH family protein [Lysobacter sp. CJ11]QYR53464.1 YqgE/AlgH family protein [Lysobacter sp. CJ11]
MSNTASLANQLLVAVPSLDDPAFSQSVALVCQHDSNGAMALVVNRPSDMLMGELLQQIEVRTENETLRMHHVLQGGPVHIERGFVLHAGEAAWESSVALGNGLALTTSRDILESIANGTGPEQSLIALGYASWAPGQLEQELADNSWIVVNADKQLLFEVPIEDRWRTATGRLGFDPIQMTGYSGRA